MDKKASVVIDFFNNQCISAKPALSAFSLCYNLTTYGENNADGVPLRSSFVFFAYNSGTSITILEQALHLKNLKHICANSAGDGVKRKVVGIKPERLFNFFGYHFQTHQNIACEHFCRNGVEFVFFDEQKW